MRYELRADVYVPKDEVLSEYPRDMDRSLTKRSIVQASLGGCLEEGVT